MGAPQNIRQIPAPTSVSVSYASGETREHYGAILTELAQRATDPKVYEGLGAFQDPSTIPKPGPLRVLALRPAGLCARGMYSRARHRAEVTVIKSKDSKEHFPRAREGLPYRRR